MGAGVTTIITIKDIYDEGNPISVVTATVTVNTCLSRIG